MTDSLLGQFLIAGKHLTDSNFHRTVVFIVEHGDNGAMGLVVNRPSTVTVAHALSEHFQLPETDDLVYVGGPVEPSALFILHDAPGLEESETPAVAGMYIGSSPGVFEHVVRTAAEGDSKLQFRIYSGCAGWAAGQLEEEIARGDWYLVPASASTVFHDDPYSVWELVLKQMQRAKNYLPNTPGNPEWN